LRIVIDGNSYDRSAVLAWEAKRMSVARRKLGLAASNAPLADQREELTERKIALGHLGIKRLLGRRTWLSERITRLTVRLSGADRRVSVCEIEVPDGSAEGFARWFDDRNNLNDERSMINACPDHYIIARDSNGNQYVLETTGGSPLPGAFSVDYEETGTLHTQPDPTYLHQVAGVAKLDDGLVIGGVRHQFRQEGEGFRALLTVEFPGKVPQRMIAEHRWHLAAEFSNWIEAAAI
jgi:hypothetical protein